jgi:putative aldouronate transport system permease protein
MGLILLITFYPLLNILALSLSSTFHITQNDVTFFPKGMNIDAYKMVLESPKIPRSYLNAVIYTGLGTFVSLVMSGIMAYALSKKDLKGRRLIMVMVIITMFFNGGMIPNYLLVRNLRMLDTLWAMIIPNAIWSFEMIILKSFFESLPDDLFEAAEIEGASEIRTLWSVALPLASPALASVALFFVMGNWNSFFIPMIYLTSPEKFPLQVVLRDMLIEDTVKNQSALGEFASLTPIALKNATIILSLIPLLIMYPYIQKFFAKGIMVGAVKG